MFSFEAFYEKYIFPAPRRWRYVAGCSHVILFMAVGALAAHDYFEPVSHASAAFPGYPRVNNLLLVVHIVFAVMAMGIGPWLFNSRFRDDYRRLHRRLGQIYVFSCLLSAMTSFPLALANGAGIIPRVGFGTLAVLWFVTTYLAYTAAVHRNFVAHRRWMMRSFALTFAFFIVQMYKLFLFPFVVIVFDVQIQSMSIKVMQSYVSWLANWFVVELYLAGTTFNGRFVGWGQFFKNLKSIPDTDTRFKLSPLPARS